MDKKESLLSFERELRTVRSCSDNTVKAYVSCVSEIVDWFEQNNIELNRATRNDFLRWKEEADKTGKAPRTLALIITSFKQYWKFLTVNEQVTLPWPEIRQRVKEQTPTNVPSAGQYLKIRDRIKYNKYGRVIEFLSGTGLRLNAALTIKKKHVRLDGRPHIIVDGDMDCKGKIAGIIPISPYVGRIVIELIKDKNQDDVLFDIPERTVQYAVNKISPDGLSLCPHSFRHFYCSMLYYKNFDGGRHDPIYVRDAAGHSSISVTDRYLKFARTVCQSDEEWASWAEGK